MITHASSLVMIYTGKYSAEHLSPPLMSPRMGRTMFTQILPRLSQQGEQRRNSLRRLHYFSNGNVKVVSTRYSSCWRAYLKPGRKTACAVKLAMLLSFSFIFATLMALQTGAALELERVFFKKLWSRQRWKVTRISWPCVWTQSLN